MDGNTFDFITPKVLRHNIAESVRFAVWLWTMAEKVEPEYQDEMVRTIVLYNIGIIEALLLFRAKKEKLIFYDEKYPHATLLAKVFQHTDQDLIISYRTKKARDQSRIWLHELIKEQKDFLGVSLHEQIVDLQDIRNTFHLAKPRTILSLKKAEKSFDLVLKLAEKIRKG